ncbi:hypothetical protein [Allokutzneria albata]|uniref:Uncharacterized protein n=1 Tax=Allokutzneria albata TaxID=211114 RepID=A0A1H0D9B3_ALLAB|nr:hypothetical protein [Allokutzneria albata]SDN66723.1 hypothetical protein SAMN04489726_7664 [Allokutzneria albata]
MRADNISGGSEKKLRRRLLIGSGVAVGLVGLVSGPYAAAAPVSPAVPVESCSGRAGTDAVFTMTPNSGNAQYRYFYPGSAGGQERAAAAPATFPGSTLVRDSKIVRGGLGADDDCPKECRDENGKCKKNCGGS